MEWKIGEIFEYNGEWYQCVEGGIYCPDCVFFRKKCNSQVLGECAALTRSDKEDVIFKKLEKVGEPYEKRVSDGTFSTFQRYKVYNSVILPKNPYMYCNFIDSTIEIEIKQNKEDMEESNNAKHSNSEKVGKNLKEFNLEAAKAGKPVCTRDGRKARIICFDKKKDIYPLIALVTDKDGYEITIPYKADGVHPTIPNNDLMMLPEKKEGWVNIYKEGVDQYIYNNEKAALSRRGSDCIATIKIEWEE